MHIILDCSLVQDDNKGIRCLDYGGKSRRKTKKNIFQAAVLLAYLGERRRSQSKKT